MHQITNVTVQVDGDRATSRCYFTVLAVTGQGLHPILAGEYRDRFERVRRCAGGSPSGSSTRGCSAISRATCGTPTGSAPGRPSGRPSRCTGVRRAAHRDLAWREWHPAMLAPRSSSSGHRATSRPACCSPRCCRSSTASGSRTCGSSGTRGRSGPTSSSTRTCAPRSTSPAPTYDEKYFDRFIDRIEFHGGDLSVESLRVLARRARRSRDLLPRVAARRVRRRGRDDRARPVSPTRATGYRRLVIEKPFGTDLDERARARTSSCTSYWREDQIFRIDHFLGKETVQNMLVFRFANRFIEPVLQRRARRRDPDHGGRDARGRRPVALLRRHRRAARHGAEPPDPDDDVRHDGAARAVGRGDDPRPQGGGAEGGARGRSRASTRCAASTRPGSSTASRASRTAPSRASTRRRAPTRSRRCACTSTRGAGRASRCCCARASGSRPRRTRSRSGSASRRRACSATRRSSTPSRTGWCSA